MKHFKIIISFVMLLVLTGCTIPGGGETPKKYTVSYDCGNGCPIQTYEVVEGEKASYMKPPVREGYEFLGWYNGDNKWDFSKDVVTSNIMLVGKWQEVGPKFGIINLVNESGEVIKTFEASTNEPIPLYQVNRVLKGYKIIGYTFNNEPWDIEKDVVKGDMDLVMKMELIKYKIEYYYNNELLEGLEPTEYTVESSASIDLPDAPQLDGYEFIGWFDGTTRVVTFFSSDAENKQFAAKYQKIKTEADEIITLPTDMTHEFTNVKKVELSGGTGFVYQPDFTGLNVPLGVQNYTFTSSNTDVVTISVWSSMSIASPGYAVIKAVNNADPSIVICCVVKVTSEGIFISTVEEANTLVSYEVTFVDDLGNVIEKQTVLQNKNATLPTPPIKEGYTFVGWSRDHVNITEDTTIQATYIQGETDFVGKTVSILGDSISTYKNYIPSGYASFYPYPTADVSDVNYTWWMRTINSLGMRLLKNNSWSGSCVSAGTGVSAATNDSRLVELTKGTERPDIIFIFMGANDCGSSNVSLSSFQTSYQTMLDKIIVMCPEAEIYLMTLPTTGLYKEADRVKYNEVIKSYAESYNLPLIDLSDLYTTTSYKEHVVDSCHPNNKGMIAISNAIIEELLKDIK